MVVPSPKWAGLGRPGRGGSTRPSSGRGRWQRCSKKQHRPWLNDRRMSILPGTWAMQRGTDRGDEVGAVPNALLRAGDGVPGERQVPKCWEEGRFLKKGWCYFLTFLGRSYESSVRTEFNSDLSRLCPRHGLGHSVGDILETEFTTQDLTDEKRAGRMLWGQETRNAARVLQRKVVWAPASIKSECRRRYDLLEMGRRRGRETKDGKSS